MKNAPKDRVKFKMNRDRLNDFPFLKNSFAFHLFRISIKKNLPLKIGTPNRYIFCALL